MDTQIRDLDLEQLKNLTNLNQLDLSSTRVSNLNPLEGLTHLSKLHIFNTQVSETSINDLKNANKNLEITRSAVFNPH
jgi:Leucine-rich repeat (LRR) protein